MTRAVALALPLVGTALAWPLAHEGAGGVPLTSPRDTIQHAAALLGSARFWPNVLETAHAFVYALAISALGGLVLGVALGAHRLSGEGAEPLLVALYAIPKITLYPLILLLFGLGDGRTIMAITLMIAVVAVLANAALLALDRRLHR